MNTLKICKYCGEKRNTTNSGIALHQIYCYKNPNRKIHYWVNMKHKEETKIKIGKNNRMGRKVPKSILDVSKRTTAKILNRLNCGCSICGWNEASCDIHHIKPKKEGGSDMNDILCILCPNCHRKVHYKKIDSDKLINIVDYIGDKWKDYYYGLK